MDKLHFSQFKVSDYSDDTRRLSDEGVDRLGSLTIFGEADKEEKLLRVIQVLQNRRHELSSLSLVACLSSAAIVDAVVGLVQDCPSVSCVSLGCLLQEHTPMPQRAFDLVREYLPLEDLRLTDFDFTETEMHQLSENICARQNPLRGVMVNSPLLSESAVGVFCEALPQMRLRQIYFNCVRSEAETCTIFNRLSQCQEMQNVDVYIGAEAMTNETIQSVVHAIHAIPGLITLTLIWLTTKISVDQCIALGRACAQRPRLRAIFIDDDQDLPVASEDGRAIAFISALGHSPRLRELSLFGDQNVCNKFLQSHNSMRARCLTALVAGATLERIGQRSPCFRIPRDVFRKLRTYLTKD